MGRSDARKDFDDHTRLRLLEDDADELELEIMEMRKEFRRLTAAIVGGAITLAVTAILLGITLAA